MESHCIATKKFKCKSSKRTFDREYKDDQKASGTSPEVSQLYKARRTYPSTWLRQNVTFRMKNVSKNFTLKLNDSWNFRNIYLLSWKCFVTVL